MGPEDLAQVLSALPPVTDPRVLVGADSSDDGAVLRLTDELALIQTVDFFTPIVDDPYTFGAIAAANSLSDVYAMGGRPISALNIVEFPKNHPDLPMDVLRDILQGGADKAREAGIDIVGGHTVDDKVPKYGLVVNGTVHPDRVWRNNLGRPGDALVLTKALGTGIVSTAVRAQSASPEFERAAIDSMAQLNRQAAEIASEFEIHACTDITGFGFLGHLKEMLREGLGARVFASQVPRLPGAMELAEAGFVPGGSKRNLCAVKKIARFSKGLSMESKLVLADAQTSGGLLLALPKQQAVDLVTRLRGLGVDTAAIVGELADDARGRLVVSE